MNLQKKCGTDCQTLQFCGLAEERNRIKRDGFNVLGNLILERKQYHLTLYLYVIFSMMMIMIMVVVVVVVIVIILIQVLTRIKYSFYRE